MTKKKILSVVLALAICFTMVAGSLSALADTPETPKTTYSIAFSDNVATVTLNDTGSDLFVALLKLNIGDLTVSAVTPGTGVSVDTNAPRGDGGAPVYPFKPGKDNTLNVLVDTTDNTQGTNVMSFTITFDFSTDPNLELIKVADIDAASDDEGATVQGMDGDLDIKPAGNFDPQNIVIPAATCNHTNTEVTYDNKTDTTHDVYCECGEFLRTEAHSFVNGKCVCGADEPAPELPTLSASASMTGFASKFEFGYNITLTYTGDASNVASTKMIFLKPQDYTSGMTITENTPNAMIEDVSNGLKTGSFGATMSGFPLSRLNDDYVFVPYVVLKDGTCIYADAILGSYYDYLSTRLEGDTATNIRARAYVNAYYNLTGTKLYDGAEKFTALPTKEYTINYSKQPCTNPDGATALTASASITGYASKFEFGYNFTLSYSGDANDVASTKVIFLKPQDYTTGMKITKDTPNAMIEDVSNGLKTGSFGATMSGFPLSRLNDDYIFVPYVELKDGTCVYANYTAGAYSDYLVSRLGSTNTTTAGNARAYVEAYQLMLNATNPVNLYK